MAELREFNNKLAVVTGAAQGIGEAVVKLLHSQGCSVVALDIQFSVGADLQPLKAGLYQCQLDIADGEAVSELIGRVEQTLGEIDYVVSVAGILRPATLLETRPEDWQRTLAVNTTGVFNLCQAVGRYMQGRRCGAMVVVGSNAAGLPRMGMAAYAVSKAATTQLVKCLGLELAQYNIRCNSVAPGSTDTAMQRQLWTEQNGLPQVIEGNLASYRGGIPLKKIAQPTDIAKVIIFLLSSNAAHITMENILVDGGATLGC